ncbi:MAG: ABC transporter substrate-binding protein [Anaerolineae bacterium]
MRKLILVALSVMVLASLALSGCGSTAEPVLQTVVVSREVTAAVTPAEPVVQTVVVTVEVTAAVAAAPTVAATPQPSAQTFERSETLYTSGTQWGPPSNWNPFMTGNYAMGTLGLVYETLFLYDPIADEYIPWLAESGQWTDDTTYELKLRQGLTWSDGQPLTVDDVMFTFQLGEGAALNFSTLWDWLGSIDRVDDSTLRFNFNEALYQEWANLLYNTPIVPQHLWGEKTAEEVATGANEMPVGSGPYLYEAYDQSRMIWVRNDNWWATEALQLSVAPTRIVDIVNGSNNVALGLVLQGGLDLSNNFLPGVATLVQGGYGVVTYYPEPPYMLSANTAWLDINLQKKPMDDVAFRRALAFSINVTDIVEKDYGNIVQAANPTGLLPIWDKYIDTAVVDQLGFSYDPEQAKQILADAGYADTNGDGFVEAPDGSEIALKIIVPNGWSDWMEAIKIIASSAQAAGINVQPDYPDYNGYLDARLNGTFDLCIDNQPQMSNTIWSYYHWIFYDQLEDIATSQGGNYGRYNNQEAFDLVTQLDKTAIDDVETMASIASQLQTIQLTDMPIIPLWYNGLWAQYSSAVWTGWPSSAEDANHYLPCTWRGYWNMTGIRMLTELEPAPAQ